MQQELTSHALQIAPLCPQSDQAHLPKIDQSTSFKLDLTDGWTDVFFAKAEYGRRGHRAEIRHTREDLIVPKSSRGMPKFSGTHHSFQKPSIGWFGRLSRCLSCPLDPPFRRWLPCSRKIQHTASDVRGPFFLQIGLRLSQSANPRLFGTWRAIRRIFSGT